MYQTISIPKLLELVTFTDIFQLEKVIVEAAKRNNLQVFIHYLRIDCLTFSYTSKTF